MAAGDPRGLPVTAWVLPQNQAARVPILADRVSVVSFVPPTTGRFTVFADVYSRGSADCHTSPAPQAALGEGQTPLGVIDVPADGPTTVTAAACRAAGLRVTVDDQVTIRVTNVSGRPCSITGTPPVDMPVGRVEGTRPSRSSVLLRPGYTYVQKQVRVPGATACKTPISAGMAGQPLSVMVGSSRIAVPNDAGLMVHTVVNCDVVTRPPGYLEP
jgi:hypothetical protein